MGKPKSGYGIYWRIWLVLLIVTGVMIFVDRPTAQALGSADQGQTVLIVILVLAMLLKATLIATYFMHLRYERLFLGLSVLIGLLLNGAILFTLIAPDGYRILEMAAP